jgi:CRP-like cAMP-binding protein
VSGDVADTSADVHAAWAGSFMGELPAALLRQLADGTRVEVFPSLSLMLCGSQPSTGVFLVVSGLVRVFLRSGDGRQTTARYASDGEFVGLTPLLADGILADAEALTKVRAIRIPPHRVRSLAIREPRLSWAIARYIAQMYSYSTETLGANIFLPVRARVARHLLDLAQREEIGYVVDVTQQHIANSIGSVREVVARDLKVFAQQAIIERTGRRIRLIDPSALHKIASGRN